MFWTVGKYPLSGTYPGCMPRSARHFILTVSSITIILEDSCFHFYFVDKKSNAQKFSGELKRAHTRRFHSRVSELKPPTMGCMNLWSYKAPQVNLGMWPGLKPQHEPRNSTRCEFIIEISQLKAPFENSIHSVFFCYVLFNCAFMCSVGFIFKNKNLIKEHSDNRKEPLRIKIVILYKWNGLVYKKYPHCFPETKMRNCLQGTCHREAQ